MAMASMRATIYQFLSIKVWGLLPAPLQRGLSRSFTHIYEKRWSRHLIRPYCKMAYRDPNYLEKFVPPEGKTEYSSFQDFFVRTLRHPLKVKSERSWPCEGLICEYGRVRERPKVRVKGQDQELHTIFGKSRGQIPDAHYFVNVFLHNNNYHRVHAPVSGEVTKIERIKGELVLLRPWVYPKKPSLPAMRNERVNIDIRDGDDKKWFLSIVGGPAVGSIVLANGVGEGKNVGIGDEIGTFLLGSTCCMAIPYPLANEKTGDEVRVGNPL